MKLRLFAFLTLAALLLSACSPKGEGSAASAGQSGTQSSQSSSDPFQPGSSSQEQPQTIPALCTADWLIEYQKELQALGCSLDQVSAHYDMLSYDWWPSGREEVRSDERVLLFSDSPHKAGAVCAAVAVDLHEQATLEQLRQEWEDTLVFVSDDPAMGPCWQVPAGEYTFRFLTDSTGKALRTGGRTLVISRDDLLPRQADPQWTEDLLPWIDQKTQQPGAVWDPVMTAAASLGQTQPPQGYTQSADAQLADSLMTGWGVKNPETGGQLFAALEGEAFEAAALPASAVLGDALPAGTDQIISALNTAFSFSQFGESGYWFYLGSYKVFLPADSQGQVAADAVFLIRWADNAEI